MAKRRLRQITPREAKPMKGVKKGMKQMTNAESRKMKTSLNKLSMSRKKY
ncbi:MAG: hypothetical protein V3R25_08770 [Nitrosomonadaceae bacterium]|jgi:hypothetical protein